MGYRDDGLDDEGEDREDDSDSEGSESKAGKDPKSTDKRIRDLQSAKDKETARANKAEGQLKALLSAGDAGSEGDKPPSPEGGDAADGSVLDMARMFVMQQHPKLVEHGVTASDLEGATPAEISQAAVVLEAHYDKIETRIRNKVLAEQGLAPEIDGGAPPPARDFTNMSKEDFSKVYDEAMNRR